MARFKKLLRKMFCLPPLPTVLIAVPSFIFVFVMLGRGEHSVWAYLSYVLSAYALVITATGLAGVLEAVKNGIGALPLLAAIRRHPLGRRLLGDAVFRSEVTLRGGLAVNLLYAAMYLFHGLRGRSTWFIALALYYLLLSAMRGVLVRYVRKTPIGRDPAAEFRCYRRCGILLLLMNQALIALILNIVYKGRSFAYAGSLIYAMAAYTFYITIAAIVNVIRYRRQGSPIISASKVISLTAALVSMLSLETAMITRFGEGPDDFLAVMTSAFGGVVCCVVLGMAIYMIVRAGRHLKRLPRTDGKITANEQG